MAQNKAKYEFSGKAVLTQLFVVSATLLALIFFIIPSRAEAGVFSVFSQLFASTDKTAPIDNTDYNSQDLPILKPDLSPNPDYGQGGGDVAIADGDALVPESGPLGAGADDVQDQSTNNQISLYTVQSGDTISAIAKMFDVSVNTIVWANDLTSTTLKQGQTLVILPVTGVIHTIVKGDTLESIAKKYGADVNEIEQFNDISGDSDLVVGQTLTIPDGEMAAPSLSSGSSGSNSASNTTSAGGKVYSANGHTFVLPTGSQPTEPIRGTGGPDYVGYYMKPVNGVLTQGLHGYNAVDIGAPIGTPIWAAAAGTIIVSKMGGWNGGYGNYVVISHLNGTQTLYAHMKETAVSVGQTVAQGQTIGYVGVTGETTGPHVHFEVRGAYNPFQ